MPELILIDLFIENGLERLVDSDWPLALAVLALVVFRLAVTTRPK